MAFAWFTIGVKWETKGGKQEKGREIDENSPLCEQTTKNDPHQSGAEVTIICFSSLCFYMYVQIRPPGPGIHAYL